MTEYLVDYIRDGVVIDSTSVDELNETLIWGLFKEFGHKPQLGDRFEYTALDIEAE